MHELDKLNIKTAEQYRDWLDANKFSSEIHHVLALSVFGSDSDCNKEDLRISDHLELHKAQDIPSRHLSRMLRKQRIRENGHIILTESDIDGRADLQGLYLEGSSKLPEALQDINKQKLIDIGEAEGNKLIGLGANRIEIDESMNLLQIHSLYIEIQKEISRRVYKILNFRGNL